MSIGQNIKERRLALSMSMEALAAAVGVSRQTVFRYENGTIENIPRDKIDKLAAALSTTQAALCGWEVMGETAGDIFPVRRKRVPMLGEIACGVPRFATEDFGGFVEDSVKEADFCLRARGDSMTGARIYDGDIVFIKAQEAVENGEIGVVVIEDEATLKRVYYYPAAEKLVLVPENPAYEPLVYLGADLDRIKILGKAVAFQSRIR